MISVKSSHTQARLTRREGRLNGASHRRSFIPTGGRNEPFRVPCAIWASTPSRLSVGTFLWETSRKSDTSYMSFSEFEIWLIHFSKISSSSRILCRKRLLLKTRSFQSNDVSFCLFTIGIHSSFKHLGAILIIIYVSTNI